MLKNMNLLSIAWLLSLAATMLLPLNVELSAQLYLFLILGAISGYLMALRLSHLKIDDKAGGEFRERVKEADRLVKASNFYQYQRIVLGLGSSDSSNLQSDPVELFQSVVTITMFFAISLMFYFVPDAYSIFQHEAFKLIELTKFIAFKFFAALTVSCAFSGIFLNIFKKRGQEK